MEVGDRTFLTPEEALECGILDAPSAPLPVVPRWTPELARQCQSNLKFDEAAKDIYLQVLAATGRAGDAARTAGVSEQTVLLHMKQFPEFKELVLEARKRVAESYIQFVQKVGMEGTWKPVFGKLDKTGREGLIGYEKVFLWNAAIVEAKRYVEEYGDKVTINSGSPAGAIVLREPARTNEEWLERVANSPQLPIDPLEGLPGISREMMKSMARGGTPDDET